MSIDYKKLYEEGTSCIFDSMNRFNVRVLSGPFRLVKPELWYKNIQPGARIVGSNVIDTKVQGYFTVSHGSSYTVLDYNQKENKGSFWLRMKDHVRKIKDSDEYIGKIYIKILGIYWPAGYFSLTESTGD